VEQSQQITGNRVRGDLVVSQTFVQQTPVDSERDRARRETAMALLQGPVEALGLGDRLERAGKLVESGDYVQAGELYLELVPRLEAAGRVVTAEVMRERAAAQFTQAGSRTRAFELYVEVTRAELARDASGAVSTARRAREVAPGDQGWLAEGLIARAMWPEHEDEVVPLLAEAWDRTRETADEAEWAAALVEVLCVLGRFDEAVDIADDVATRVRLQIGARLALELDRLDAAGEIGRDIEVEWERLIDWTRGHDDPLRALVLQRRGVFLSRAGRPEPSVAAFREASTHWGNVRGGGDEQLAESYFAEHVAWELAGRFAWGNDGARVIAMELGGDPHSAAARAQELVNRGVRELLEGRTLLEAKRCLLLALATHRRAGNLRGTLEVHGLLARLFDRVGDRSRTLAHYVACGNAKQVGEVAKNGEGWTWSEIEQAIRLQGAPWERAASFAALAELGGYMPDDEVAAITPDLLDAAGEPPVFASGPQQAHQARRALAALICAVPDGALEQTLALLRDEVRNLGWSDREAVRALGLITRLGRSDETTFLLEASLAKDANAVRSEAGLVIERLREDAELRAHTRAAALAGNAEALELLAYAGIGRAETDLRMLCAERVREYVGQRDPDQPPGVRSAALVSLSALGVVGRYADAELRRRLSERLMRFALDTGEFGASRASAASALLNLACHLDTQERERVREALFALAVGAYRSDWNGLLGNHPLSSIQVSIGQPNDLQAMAIRAFCAVTEDLALVQEQLDEVLGRALSSQDPALIQAALDGLLRLPDIVVGPDFAHYLRHPNARIRAVVIRLLVSRDEKFIESDLALVLAQDQSRWVRSSLLGAARDVPSGGERALVALAEDPDAYIRAAARRLIRNS
jgi:hypothetical protein